MPPGPTVEEAAQNIVDYHDGLTEITDNIQDIRDRAGGVVDDLSIVRKALDQVQSIRDEVSAFGDDVDKLQLVFKLMDKAGPLKGIAKVGTNMLKRVDGVVDKVEDKIDAIARKITDSQINQKLETAIGKIEEADLKLAEGQSKVIGQRDSFEGVANIAAKAYVVAEEPILALGTVMDAPAAAVTRINDVYNDIVGVIDRFNGDFPASDFNALLTIETGIGRISGVLASIRAPLDVVYGALKPIEPILSAVGLVSKFTVDPVIDFLLSTLGIDDVINAAADKITQFLPDVDVLDALLDRIDEAVPDLDGILTDFGNYDDDGDEAVDENGTPRGDDVENPATGSLPTPRIADPFGIGQWVVDEIEAQLIQTATEVRDAATNELLGYVRERIGSLDAQGLAVFVEIPEPLAGSDDDDDLTADVAGVPVENVILVGDDLGNRITAFDGDNMLYGAGGDDTLVGEGAGSTGAGRDTAVFTGPLGQYVFSWADLDDAGSDLTVEHVSPLDGVSFDGTDLLQGIERVTFLGTTVEVDGEEQALTLTMQDLRDFVRTVNTDFVAPAGTTDNLYVFANYAPGAANGLSITGGGADDLLVGGLASDTINGGAGDDTIEIGGGFDSFVDGGAGRDLFTVGADRLQATIDLQARFAESFGSGSDFYRATLVGIENVSVAVTAEAFVYGDDLAAGNALTSGSPGDVFQQRGHALHGRGGTDTLLGGKGDDTLVGGFDIDTLDGGAGDDHIVATDSAVSWSAPTDPATGLPMGEKITGGDGQDVVYYTTLLSEPGTFIRGAQTYLGPFSQAIFGNGFESDRQKMQQAIGSSGWIETRLREATAQNPAIVEVRRMSDRDENGLSSLLAVDTLDGVEQIVATNSDDVLHGLTGAQAFNGLFGAGGDDTIHAEGAVGTISGDAGRDLVLGSARLLPQVTGDRPATGDLTDGSRGDARIYVGDAFDTLDLSGVGDVRWSISRNGGEQGVNSVNYYLRPFDARDGQASTDALIAGSIHAADQFRGFGTIILSDQDDVVDLIGDSEFNLEVPTSTPPFDTDLRAGDGADALSVYGAISPSQPVWTLWGEGGDDTIEILGDAIGDGGAGDDDLLGIAGQATLRGGAGDDTIAFLEAFGSVAEGGDGTDLLVLPSGFGDVYVDLKENTAEWGGSFATVTGFEAVAGFGQGDRLDGSGRDDKLSGNDGEDTLWGGDLNRFSTGVTAFTDPEPNIGTYLRFQGDHEAALSGSITIEAWITTVSDTPGLERIVMLPSGTGLQRLSLALKDGEAHLRADTSQGAKVMQSGHIADGAEHHIVARYDTDWAPNRNALLLWVDGAFQGFTSFVEEARPADGDILIGAAGDDFRQFIDAEIPRVRIWTDALDPIELATTGQAPYIDVEATGDRRDLLAPSAQISQGGRFADPFVIAGETTGQDAIYGGADADSISGGDGDDFLHPGGGGNGFGETAAPDTIEGGRGRDTASFAFAGLDETMRAAIDSGTIDEAFEAVDVDLETGEQRALATGALRTEFSSIENVIGTHLNDVISGNALGNVLTGGEGDDTINGRGGDDVIAALGADLIDAGLGDDTIGIGLADATVAGGDGTDLLVFAGDDTVEAEDGRPVQANSFTYDLLAGTYAGQVSEEVPVWATLYDGGTANETRSTGGEDLTPLMVRRADPDEARSMMDAQRAVPDYDPGADPEDGSRNPTDFRLAFVATPRAVSGEFTGIEMVRGASGKGSNAADHLIGSAFADDIGGRDGNDTLEGGDGADTLDGGLGADLMVGGAGGDLYVVDRPGDRITEFAEGGGVDHVIADSDYALGAAHVEQLTLRNAAGSRGEGNDLDNRIEGAAGDDTLLGGDGLDTLIGNAGDDSIQGGATEADLRDVIFAGDGDDVVGGGHGNDELNGMGGNDTMEGGFGVDRLVGGDGDDVLTGSAFSDQIFGNDGFDFINGGFGSDRVNGGAGSDRFFHLGVTGHGSDWIQDFSAAEGDVLVYGGAATRDQFQVNLTATAGAGEAGTNEAFVIYIPTGQILWALVDGAGQDEITLRLSGVDYDLLAL